MKKSPYIPENAIINNQQNVYQKNMRTKSLYKPQIAGISSNTFHANNIMPSKNLQKNLYYSPPKTNIKQAISS